MNLNLNLNRRNLAVGGAAGTAASVVTIWLPKGLTHAFVGIAVVVVAVAVLVPLARRYGLLPVPPRQAAGSRRGTGVAGEESHHA